MGNVTTASPITAWLTRIDSTRNQLIESARAGNRVAASFAMADARAELMESLSDEGIRAKLLRITDPRLAMVELANNPTDDDRIRVCAMAILSGFVPGEDQFAVFGGGKNPGKLYTKEKGFRVLFSHLGIVPEVRTTHPEFVAFGTSGKKIWRVGGSASCMYQGREYAVDFSGDELIGIPGYDSDNVAGVSAKARRRILQALWVKVSPILSSEVDADDPDTIPLAQSEPAHIHVEISREDLFKATWKNELSSFDGDDLEVANQLKVAWANGDAAAVERLYVANVPGMTNTRRRDTMTRFVDAIGAYLKAT